jgi:hypothetical protein
MQDDITYLGDFSATPVQYSRYMECLNCKVSWHGCWDNFQCPRCGEGELPNSDMPNLLVLKVRGNK